MLEPPRHRPRTIDASPALPIAELPIAELPTPPDTQPTSKGKSKEQDQNGNHKQKDADAEGR